MISGSEPFMIGKRPMSITVDDYWQWTCSNISNSGNLSILAEFIVASSIKVARIDTKMYGKMQGSYILLSPDGYRLDVISSAYIRSFDEEHPDHILFHVADKRMPDVYIFCVYKALEADRSPLDLDLWDFYVLQATSLRNATRARDMITFRSLMDQDPMRCDYYGIERTIQTAMKKNA